VTRAAGLGLLVVLAIGLGGVATAQGLGDTATRERKRREKEKKPPSNRVYTNDDLEKGRPPGEKTSSSADATLSGSATSSESPSEAPPMPDMAGSDRRYIDAVREAQERVTAIEKQIQQANGKLNPMSTDYIYGSSGSNNANDELQVRQELSDLQQQLVQARQDLATANQALANARQGRPAGSSEGE
jgi:hypothetical protein